MTGGSAIPIERSRYADYVALTKPRLNLLVIATAAAGFYLGSRVEVDYARFVNTVVGTALVAGGASALNQLFERRVDGLMRRTMTRPLPGGRIQPVEAGWFALFLSAAGLVLLAVGANWIASLVALVTLLTYVAAYTPLKLRTSLATVVGAIPGALPPMIGWAGATGGLSREAWILFAIVFLWQMPHFLAIAWLFRDDYARAGFPLLPVVEPDGHSTARQVLAYTGALLPVSLTPTAVGLASAVYFVGAFVLGLAFMWLAFGFARRRTDRDARRLFIGSITYLPVLWILMIAARN